MSQKDEESKTVGEESCSAPEDKAPEHPIATAVDRLIHRARDIIGGRLFVPVAFEVQKSEYEEIGEILDQKGGLLDGSDTHTQVLARKEVLEALVRYYRLRQSQVPEVLEKGLFLGLFSAFDAFTGDLFKGLYERKPDLFESLNQSLSFADVLKAPSIEALKQQVLESDIESLRRKSYVDQFEAIDRRFDVPLTDFERWPDFVECSQRRNLLTHCDGIVTDQYLSVCRKAGVDISKLPVGGSEVKLGAKYFYASCELVMEVGVKLGHTLWRKVFPAELEEADEHLRRTLYEALENRSWPRARVVGEFAFNQKKMSNDEHRKIITINYVQALKRDDAVEEAEEILNKVDWSAAADPFKLARAVLMEDYQEASTLMKKIGRQEKFISEDDYHMWPLFIEFRETDEFASTYLEVFGHPYVSKLREKADQTSQEAAEEAQKDPSDDPSDDKEVG